MPCINAIIHEARLKGDDYKKLEAYVQMNCGDYKAKTKPIKNSGPNPNWGETISCHYEIGKQVSFQVKDKDTIKDDTIGTGTFSAADLSKPIKGEVVLLDKKGTDMGRLVVTCHVQV